MSAGITFQVEMTQMAHVSHSQVNSVSPAHMHAIPSTHPRMPTAASFTHYATVTLW